MKLKKRKSLIPITYDSSPCDPFGSYTGVAKDGDKPVQDADDL